MKIEYLWFGIAIIAFQSILLATFNFVTLVKEKIPESRKLRKQVGTAFFIIGLLCSLFASYGYSKMFHADKECKEPQPEKIATSKR